MNASWLISQRYSHAPSHSPLSTLHPIHTELCLQCSKSSVAKQPPSTHSSKPVHQSCTNYSNNGSGICKNNYYYAESQPASHYSIPQAAQITKHLLPGMVAQLVKIPARSLILLLAAFTHKYILSLSDHRPTKSPTV